MKSTYINHYKRNKKQFKVAVTFLTAFIGIFNLTNSNNKFYFRKTLTGEDGFVHITITPGDYEIEALDKELKRIIIGENHFTQANYLFKFKPNLSLLG